MSEEIKNENQTNESQEAQEAMSQVAAVKKGDIVKGKIIKVEQDQAIVDIGYKYDGTIPLRELSSVQIENADQAVQEGQEIELKIVTIDDNKEKLVLSKRSVDSEKAWETLQQKLDEKVIIEAVVAEVVKGGLVVDVGVRGFVPASMVERSFVEDFSDYKGRTLRLRVKEIDREKNKVILSQKDVLDEEYEAQKKDIISKIEVGKVYEGTVQRLTQFGAFVDIGGIDGLVHISEMAWHHVEHPSEIVKEGDKVSVQVLKVDPEKDKVSLSLKATQEGPWEKAEKTFTTGEIITGTVKRLAGFGAFVEIAPGVEGLVHISQIAHRHIATPQEVLKEGQEVKVKVLDVNAAEKRVSLSIKETEEAPAQTASSAPSNYSSRPERSSNHQKELAGNENVSLSNQGLSMTLGERFGDKLSKFKK
ncbi:MULTISPECIES: 30S ribosomal protein S1 [Paenibacillus]|uniref:30S ribosomal protein S1 n=1 Tax=Paenibacillus chitinolyticus TaxID=79263 RepID=A0A410WV65_9BACL|nr:MULTISPECIES: 30S ribosomal protein S1 [Paenibacillus]EGL17197.1 30S ribosomal protein S1 [Paenibacillus sp. HGF7]EPD80754.1 ribosomal protein S1 [Paenibacillus sp. HGH0039]MBV6714618.1 30S ribosomal protein S1 [Paenibacillus chitinolyticus]MCY9589392.1 30S ribosomal protein S1 [Paenibacillus chitinolyticus]MCY9594465.1 30S ribosomal protein S1 [Paenibacillus chitinolyticus]